MSQWLKVRLGLVFFCFFCFFSLVGFRLVQLQVLPNQALSELSQRQFTKTDRKAPFRVPVYDRNHQELAVSIPVSSIYAHPKKLISRRKTAALLTKQLGGSPAKWLQKLDPKKNFVWLQRQLSEEKAQQIKNLNLAGLGVESENKRVYPNGPLASQVLGYTDIDGNGLAGIELSLNATLLQDKQRIKYAKDGKGNKSYIERGRESSESSTNGIHLTIDRRLQAMVEQELEQVKTESKAKNVMAIVMNPRNGEVLALAQRPSFDPNNPSQSQPEARQNLITQSLYEPGSTLKVLFAAEAIERQLLKADTVIDCGNGKIKVGQTTISESDKKHQHSALPLTQVIAYSSNVGAVRVAQKLGTQAAVELLQKYGLTQKTGIELSGETTGALRSKEAITPLLLATMGFGQGLSTTPIQLVTAFTPFANGGYLVTPTLIKYSTEKDDTHVPFGERVISEETAETMRSILVAATEDQKGTGYLAKIAGVRVAGKTGTAQKYDSQGGGYKSGKYYSSFVGFLPAEDPQFLIGVMVDEPKQNYYASLVATPLFKRIAEHSLQLLEKGPAQTVPQNTAGRRKDIIAPKELAKNSEGQWVMPSLKGLTLNEAMTLLNRYVNKVEVSGNGYVTTQNPEPGAVIHENTAVGIQLKGFSD
ncbi:PASTA domain-containing protein [bacterium]|nr:PASTA domain-containing protein [bacterium]